MTTKLLLDVCELTNQPCRHVSCEVVYRPYTKIVKENGVYKPTGQGKKCCEIGQICNTQEIGKNPWISEMHYCPILWSKARYGAIPVGEKKKVTPIRKSAPKKKVKK